MAVALGEQVLRFLWEAAMAATSSSSAFKVALLYLRSRAIPSDSARTMLIFAFLNESLVELADDEFRAVLVDELLGNLPGGDFIRSL